MAASIIKNISWLGFSSVIVKPIWFVFITYICYRAMGTSQYGLMTASLALMTILGGIASLGTSQYTIREVARNHEQASRYFSNLFPARLVLGFVCLLIGLATSTFLNGETAHTTTFLVAGAYALILNLTEYCRAFFRAHEILRDEALSIVLEKILAVGLGSLTLLWWPTAAGALLGISLGMFVTLLLNLGWLHRKFARLSFHLIDWRFIRESIRHAYPLGLVGIFVLIYFRTDSVMLQAIDGDTVTGQYGIAFRFLEALLLFPGIIVAVLLPRLSSLFGEHIGDTFHTLLVRSLLTLFILGIAVAAVFTYGAPLIISIFESGPSAEPAALALQILVWTFPLSSVNYLFSTALTAANDQVILAWLLGIAVIFNLALNAILIPEYSLYGACVATLLTQAGVSISMGVRYVTLLRRDKKESAT